MSEIITRTRLLINDPSGSSQQFADSDIQDTLDQFRDDVRYEGLTIAPTIVNLPSTGNQPVVIFADYYSQYGWWEADVVLEGINIATNAAWIVLTPVSSDYIVGHWQFELTPFVNGTAPGQYPPVFATGKIHDPYAAAAELLELWSATLVASYDITVDGQTLRRSQLAAGKQKLADIYRRKARPRVVKMRRDDIEPQFGARRMRLLDSQDIIKGT